MSRLRIIVTPAGKRRAVPVISVETTGNRLAAAPWRVRVAGYALRSAFARKDLAVRAAMKIIEAINSLGIEEK